VVVEKDLQLKDLEGADEVFITSTTRNLLPVLEVEGIRVQRQGEVRQHLADAFAEYVRKYVAKNKEASAARGEV
jgi:branched-subunit amino acid aminotransferase/4-amino-4-deoxychorismate lyase